MKQEPGLTEKEQGGTAVHRSRSTASNAVVLHTKEAKAGRAVEEEVLKVFPKDSLHYLMLLNNKKMVFYSKDQRNEYWANFDDGDFDLPVVGTLKNDIYASTHILLLPTCFQVHHIESHKHDTHPCCLSGDGDWHIHSTER